MSACCGDSRVDISAVYDLPIFSTNSVEVSLNCLRGTGVWLLMPVCNIPVDSPRVPDGTGRPSPAWLRPVRRRASASPAPDRPSPNAIIDFQGGSGDIMSNPAAIASSTHQTMTPLQQNNDLEALFNTSEYFDLSAMSPGPITDNSMSFNMDSSARGGRESLDSFTAMAMQNQSQGGQGQGQNPAAGMMMLGSGSGTGMNDFARGLNGNGSGGGGGYGDGEKFDFGLNGLGANGFGGETLAGEGMDSVSDGLKGNENGQGL